jgi:uncharacterized protein (TIGR02265 family)
MSETRRLVFPTSVEGLFKGLGPRVTPEVISELRRLGLDIEKLPPAIPVETWTPILQRLAVLVAPSGTSTAQAYHDLGYHYIVGWQRTLMGSAAATLLRVLGPARTLTRLDRAFRTSDNFSRAETVMVNATECLITINEVQGMPTYWQGVFEAGLVLLGLTGSVDIEEVTPPGCRFRLKWK